MGASIVGPASITVVVRTHHDPGTGPQYNYLPPHIAVDPLHADALTARRKQLLDALETVGIPRGDYLVRVNNRKVLNGVMEVAGVLDPSDPDRFVDERGIVLRAIDKLDRLGDAGVRMLLGEGRKDDSGDWISSTISQKSFLWSLTLFYALGWITSMFARHHFRCVQI